MSEKDLEQLNADVQENEAATAAPVDNASPEAIGEAIKEINGEADASAAPEKADDELQVGVIKPIATGKPESKRALKKAEKKKAKELKNIYHVSNWQIIKNYRNYNQQERKHYKYIFRRRITEKVWPVFRFLILFGLGFVILYPMLYMLSTAIRPQAEMSDPSVMWIPKEVIFSNFVDVWVAMNFPKVLLQTILVNVVCSMIQVRCYGLRICTIQVQGQGTYVRYRYLTDHRTRTGNPYPSVYAVQILRCIRSYKAVYRQCG